MRGALLVLVACLAACGEARPTAHIAFAVTPSSSSRYLRYRGSGAAGEWTREVVLTRDGFAERRDAGGRAYIVGARGPLAWMRVGARPPVELDPVALADELPQIAWLGVRFAQPEAGDRLELESCHADACTWAFTPRAGHTLWLDVARDAHAPRAVHWISPHGGITTCDGIVWRDVAGGAVVASAWCTQIVSHVGEVTTLWRLDEARDDRAPEWARVAADEVVPLTLPKAPATFAVADPSYRVLVPVEAGGAPPMTLVVDTGSPITVLSRRAADAIGVALTPDAPIHVRPPWLPESTFDAAIVDRLAIGPIELHGVPVVVAREPDPFGGDEAGLLGVDVLARFIADVDGPASAFRLWPRAAFRAPRGSIDLALRGASHGEVVVRGAVDGVGEVPVVLDTGAPLNVVVGGPEMHAAYPRHARAEATLEDGSPAPDYDVDIDGFHLGPFALPRMPALGRDRVPDRPLPFDSGAALAGLGVMRHFRLAFDLRDEVVHALPGPSYVVLQRLGVEIDDRDGAPIVTHLVARERSWNDPVREGDVVLAVDGRDVSRAADARAAIARARGTVHLRIGRGGRILGRTIALLPWSM